MDVGDWLALYAAVLATIVALGQLRRARPPIAVWFEVSAERDLVVHVTNTGRRPLSVDFVGLRGPWWRREGPGLPLAPRGSEPAIATLMPGGTTQRTIARAAFAEHAASDRRWIYAGTTYGTGRRRRIPAAVIRHVTAGPHGSAAAVDDDAPR